MEKLRSFLRVSALRNGWAEIQPRSSVPEVTHRVSLSTAVSFGERPCLSRTLISFHKHLIFFLFSVCVKQSPYLPLKDKDFMTACCGYQSGDHGVTFKLLSKAVRLSPIGLHSIWTNISFSPHTTYASARATTLCPLNVFCLCSDTYLYFCGFLVAFSA